jgi:integrase
MATNKKAFTELWLNEIKPNARKRLEFGDKLAQGLVVRIEPSGSKSYSVIYKIRQAGLPSTTTGKPLAGPQQRVTLGSISDVKLEDARAQALRIRQSALSGIDPKSETRITAPTIAVRATNTVRQVKERYISQSKDRLSKWKDLDATLERYIVSDIGDWPIENVKRSHLHEIFDGLGRDFGEARVLHVRGAASRLWAWAAQREPIDTNPLLGMRRDERYRPRERVLSDHELALIWNAASTLGYPYGPCIQLMALTGLREGNASNMQWDWIDEGKKLAVLPIAEFKSRRPFSLPLSEQAWALCSSLPRWSGSKQLFRPARTGEAINGWSKVKVRLDRIIAKQNQGKHLPPWVLHDLRRTLKTGLAKQGVKPEIRDLCLGHANGGGAMDEVYNLYDYLDERLSALEAWGKHVVKMAHETT